MDDLYELIMRMFEFVINSDQTAWLAKPPAVEGWEDPDHVADLWKVPGKEEAYQRMLVRIHYRWRENAAHPDHPSLPKDHGKATEVQTYLHVEQSERF